MAESLSETGWTVLLAAIEHRACTPFLGAGACHGALPLGSEIAKQWAKKYTFPFPSDCDLTRVSQYIAAHYDDDAFPKQDLLNRIEKADPPNFRDPDEPHRALADLPLPIYLTTNYDDFMFRALKHRLRDPRREECRWNDVAGANPPVFGANPQFAPTPANPLVYHLHGYTSPDTLVLTEDDYLRFLVRVAQDPELLPEPVESALRTTSLLFVGYSLTDWSFRVLLQLARPHARRKSFAVMLPPPVPTEHQEKARDYLGRFHKSLKLDFYWGTAREFFAELRARREQRQHDI